MAPPFALPPPDFPLPAYVRRVESGLLVPRKAVLPGLYLPPAFLGSSSSRPITSITLVGSAASSQSTINIPDDVQGGDIILLADYTFSTTKVVPSGFTEIASITDGEDRFTASYKIADGTETTVSIQSGLGIIPTKTLVVLRGDRPITSIALSPVQTRGLTGANPSPINLIASGGTAPLLVVGFYGVGSGSSGINPRIFSPEKDGEASSGGSFNYVWIAWRFDAVIGQDTTIDMDDEGSDNGLIGCYLELRS